MVQQILSLYSYLHGMSKQLGIFIWIPSHICIEGNETVGPTVQIATKEDSSKDEVIRPDGSEEKIDDG